GLCEGLWSSLACLSFRDKAGGYGIQALGGMLVEYIHGDFLNVVGFPLNHFCKQLDLIYNHKLIPCDTELLGSNGSPTTSSLPSGPAPSDPHHADSPIQNGLSASPAPKVKRREGQSTPDDGSWALVNSLSKCSEGQENLSAGGSGSAVPPVASRGQHMNLPYVIENERTDDLKWIIELMDGFKASKALFTAAKMRVFDLLQNRPGLGGVEVARALEASLRGTECLLEACVALGLLERTQGALQSVRRCFRSSPLQGLRFEVVPSWFKETLDKRLFKAPQEYAVETARQKALEVARRMPFKHLKTPDIVIGADTIVTVDGLILEKPVDKQDAYRMLSRLSGKEHSVCTGVAIVLCHQRDTHQDAVYQNSRLAQRYLRSNSATSLLGYLEHCDELVWPLFSHLEGAVREGTNQHAKVSGQTTSNTTTSTTDNNLFQNLYSRDAQKLRFMRAMHSIAGVAGPAVAAVFDLSRFKTACDLGGCTGSMAYALAKAYPGLSVTVFDLPSVVEASGAFSPPDANHRETSSKTSCPKRTCTSWPGSSMTGRTRSEVFLDRDRRGPSRGLLQALSMSEGRQRSTEEYAALLEGHGFTVTRVAHTHSSAVLVAQALLDGTRAYPALQSLNMLTQTLGRERTGSQYTQLLHQHGFGNIRVAHTWNFLDVVLAVKN
ncbi:hypothetical protein CRUP_020961, partial [Coryphaenoides rupestris]